MLDRYPDVIRDQLGEKVLDGSPMHIYLKEDQAIRPKRVLTARQVPRHCEAKAKELIKQMELAGVITPVEEPTRFISASHFVDKPNGGVRLTTD